MPLAAVVAISAAASIGSAVIGANAASQNGKIAQSTAAQNAQQIEANRTANTGLIGDQKKENTDLLTKNHDVNAGVIDAAQGANQGVLDAANNTVQHNIASGSEGINQSIVDTRQANTGLYQGTYDRGQQAGQAIQALLGLSGSDAQTKAFGDWANSSGYKFQLQAGSDAVSSNKATAGLLKSGGALKALEKYGQDLGSTYEGKYYDQLNGQQQTGMAAAAAIANANNTASSNYLTNTSNNVSALNRNASDYASGTLANSNNTTGLTLENNSGTANTLAGLNTGATNALVSGNTASTNALVGNANTGAAGQISANNAGANAISNGIGGIASNLVTAYGYSQGASSYGGQNYSPMATQSATPHEDFSTNYGSSFNPNPVFVPGINYR
jgi:hypothetical protein